MNSSIKREFVLLILRGVKFLLFIPLALPLVLLVRALRPLKLIRFGRLYSVRVGDFVLVTETYLCLRDRVEKKKRPLDLFYYIKPVCNQQLRLMWERDCRLRGSDFIFWLYRVNSALPGGQPHTIGLSSGGLIHDTLDCMPGHLKFTAEEERLGEEALRRVGIPQGAKFFCFHARDSAYLAALKPGNNWDYHDYRDFSVQDYLPAVEELVKRGYFAVRMGTVVKEPFPYNNPMVIDYALSCRSDFLDVYLCAKCSFFLGGGSGVDEIPKIFGRPVGYVNFIPFGVISAWSRTELSIPKKLWLRDKKRFVFFAEIFNSKIGKSLYTHDYQDWGIEIVNNTPEEIRELAVELEERIRGVWKETEEDRDLQERFRQISGVGNLKRKFTPRIGSVFLRQNRQLFG